MPQKKKKYWVAHVQESSNAMDLPFGIFTWPSKQIAKGLQEAVLASDRTKGTKFQSAMSMLNYYINRAGKKLPEKDKKRLEAAKIELRKLFEKPIQGTKRSVQQRTRSNNKQKTSKKVSKT